MWLYWRLFLIGLGILGRQRGDLILENLIKADRVLKHHNVAKLVRRRLDGKTTQAFRYRNRGSMATVGRGFAVADLGRIRLRGFLGWVAWLTLHLLWLNQFENRMLVLVQWAWSYWTWSRSARLMIGGTGRAAERLRKGRDVPGAY